MSSELSEQLCQEAAGNDGGDVVYTWPSSDIRLADELAEKPIKLFWGAIETRPRNGARTSVDSSIDMVSFLNNHQTWNAAASRFMLWFAALLGELAIGMLFWATSLTAQDEGLTFRQEVSKQGSVSGLYRDSHGSSPTNRLFEAFMSCASLLILFSNFGFYILPRWEKPHAALQNRRDEMGKHSYQIFRTFFVCFNYRRTEATSNWVIGEEGLFKITWQIVTPVLLLLAATVPSPAASESSVKDAQSLTHRTVAALIFVSYFVCEMYQLIRGERIFRRATSSTQIGRFVCMILALIGMLGYVALDTFPKDPDSLASFICAIMEAIAFILVFIDMQLICLIPIKAELSVFALGGTKRSNQQMMRVQSVYNKVEEHEA